MERVRETFIVKELCLIEALKKTDGPETTGAHTREVGPRLSAQQPVSPQHIMGRSWLWINGLGSTVTVPLMWKNKSLAYANVRVLRANQESALNLWAQSETLLASLSLILLAESLANPKAGCHYLDQTSQAQFAHVDQTSSHTEQTNHDNV